MSKKREYKTTCVGDYKIAIDICDNDVPCVMVWKHLEKDKIENVFGYYSKDVVDFFLTFINKRDEQNQRMAELEQQLAEKDKLIEFYINSGKEQCEEINKINHQALTYCDEIDNLTNQLAEKKKEIDKLEDKLHHYYEETLNKGICGLCDHLRGEYKADFAIAQLEKVKEWLEPKYFDYEQIDYLTKIINLQIKELKEKK